MQTVRLQTGELVLDGAGFVSLAAVVNACQIDRCRGFVFYNGARYGVSAQQLHAAVDHGRLFATTIERRGDEALYNTPGGAGIVDLARSGLDAWGMPHDTSPTILSCVDFSAVPSQYPQLDRFHEDAADRADATGVWIGYYGQTEYGNHLVAQPFWKRRDRPSWTWGGKGVMGGTALKQEYGFPSGVDWSSVGILVDESRGVAGLTMVSGFGSPPPPTEESDMPPLFYSPDAIHWPGSPTLAGGDYPAANGLWFTVMPDGTVRHVTAAEAAVLGGHGWGPVSLPGATFGQLLADHGVSVIAHDAAFWGVLDLLRDGGQEAVSRIAAASAAATVAAMPAPPASKVENHRHDVGTVTGLPHP